MCFEGRRNQSNKKMVERWEGPGALYGGTVFQETSRMSNILGKGKQDYGVFSAAGGNLSRRGVMGEKEGNEHRASGMTNVCFVPLLAPS